MDETNRLAVTAVSVFAIALLVYAAILQWP
jgi:hypothetical protein